MREKPESVDFPNAASQGAKIGSISQPSPTGNPATIGCVYSCTGAFSFARYEMKSLGNGRYEYEAKIYTSPTAVVRAITGKSHYNGVIWWGLRK